MSELNEDSRVQQLNRIEMPSTTVIGLNEDSRVHQLDRVEMPSTTVIGNPQADSADVAVCRFLYQITPNS